MVETVSLGKPGDLNYDRDYIDKRREYTALAIPEYRIIDSCAIVVIICTLQTETYQTIEFRGGDTLESPNFPLLKLTAANVLSAGKLTS